MVVRGEDSRPTCAPESALSEEVRSVFPPRVTSWMEACERWREGEPSLTIAEESSPLQASRRERWEKEEKRAHTTTCARR